MPQSRPGTSSKNKHGFPLSGRTGTKLSFWAARGFWENKFLSKMSLLNLYPQILFQPCLAQVSREDITILTYSSYAPSVAPEESLYL